ERLRRNEEISLLECLQFADKRDLVLRDPKLCDLLGISTKRGRSILKRAEALRNNLTHSQPDLVAKSTWEEIIETATEIERMLEASDSEVGKMVASEERRRDQAFFPESP
ncbi:MAG TPA: hypothetical protein VMO47_13395, partial [Rhodothermales bacterium]|nr:hypothetical protein [Rhodothermales bacterium]